MKPAAFSYEAPATVAAALASLAARGEAAKIIAGGQSLAPMLNMRIAQPGHLIDINRIAELGRVRLDGDTLVIGALARHADLARDPLVREHAPMLAYAASTIGHYAIRQRGTIGGSLAHADPAAQLPLAALALDATIEVASESGGRQVPASAFFSSVFTTVLEPHELVVAVRVSRRQAGEGWGFRLFTRRAGDFALALVACTLRRSGGKVEGLRVAAGGIGPTPMLLDGGWPGVSDEVAAARLASAMAAVAPVEDNERIPAAYRRDLLEALIRDALADALERAA
jgi:carbon-monoxide dehydrogenase medium subunit